MCALAAAGAVRGVTVVGVAVVADKAHPRPQRARRRRRRWRRTESIHPMSRASRSALRSQAAWSPPEEGTRSNAVPSPWVFVPALAGRAHAQPVGAQDPQRVGQDPRVDLLARWPGAIAHAGSVAKLRGELTVTALSELGRTARDPRRAATVGWLRSRRAVAPDASGSPCSSPMCRCSTLFAYP